MGDLLHVSSKRRDQLRAVRVLRPENLMIVLKSCPRLTEIHATHLYSNDTALLANVRSLERVQLSESRDLDVSVLSQLKQLSLTVSSFSGDLRSLTHLRALTLSQVSVKSIAFVLELPLLEKLSLSKMRKSICLVPLGELNSERRLTSLVLIEITIFTLVPLANGSLPSMIKHLEVKRCLLRWMQPPTVMFMASFTKLEFLSFENSTTSRDFLMLLSSHDTLHSLCTPCSLDLDELARCSQLQKLNVNFTHTDPKQVISALRNLTQLRRLIVSGARIHDVLKALPSLQSLHCGRDADWQTKTSSVAPFECKLFDIQPHSALRSIELEHTTWYPFLSCLVPNLLHLSIDDVIPFGERVVGLATLGVSSSPRQWY